MDESPSEPAPSDCSTPDAQPRERRKPEDDSPSLVRHTELCNFCVKLTSLMTGPVEDEEDFWKVMTIVEESESTCSFCDILFKESELRPSPQPGNSSDKSNLTVGLRRFKSALTGEQDLFCRYRMDMQGSDSLSCFEVDMAAWADQGTPACERFVQRVPILSPSIKNVSDLARNWLNECCSIHKSRECSSQRHSELPSRVLSLEGDLEIPTIRLVKSKGDTGIYCALSHCWGPPDRQPLRTTISNFQEHLTNIPFERLPKTFQDTVMLAYGMGIKRVWIDSLCIVQDDTKDWDSEATKMRNVYNNAALVVLASGAKDSSEGLYVTNRLHSVVHEVPYRCKEHTNEYLKVAIVPSHRDGELCNGPLYSRAWALQEWYLAQRIIAFMPERISWRCTEIELNELGYSTQLGFYEKESWHGLLSEYSRKHLTYKTDRLHALRGIAQEMSQSRKDRYYHEYGVWEGTLHQDLLWYQQTSPSGGDSLSLPSWSWAATGGAKWWCGTVKASGKIFTKLFKSLRIGDSGSLITAACLSRDSLRFRPTRNRSHYHVMGQTSNADESFPVLACRSDRTVMGVAAFDSDESIPHARCFFVAADEPSGLKTDFANPWDMLEDTKVNLKVDKREECLGYTSKTVEKGRIENDLEPNPKEGGSPCNGNLLSPLPANSPGAAGESTGEGKLLDEDGDIKESIDEGLNDDEINDKKIGEETFGKETSDDEEFEYDLSFESDDDMRTIDLRLINCPGRVHWALLLEPVADGKFKRVGLAVLHPDAPKYLNTKLTEFEIV